MVNEANMMSELNQITCYSREIILLKLGIRDISSIAPNVTLVTESDIK
jgi:hypothetical protein